MRKVLERLNFDVFFAADQSRTELLKTISDFQINADLYPTVLLYYTGHGVQIDGENYFLSEQKWYGIIWMNIQRRITL